MVVRFFMLVISWNVGFRSRGKWLKMLFVNEIWMWLLFPEI